MFEHDDAPGLSRALHERDLWINPMGPGRLRAVTHLDVDADAINDALDRIAATLDRRA